MRRFRNFTAIILTLLFILSSAASAAQTPVISADSAILIEASTGRVIYEKAADVARPPASMTKMMTCILALEYFFPDEEIRISQSAAATEDSDLELMAGDVLTSRELLRGMMLVSDNGGAVAVAQAIGGDVSRFAEMMNEKAIDIGCLNTHFENPHGLPNNNHYSTARDMAKIAAYCMKNYDFRDIVSTQRETIHWLQPSNVSVKVENSNKLLGKYKGVNGIKTGWTRAAGGCLATSARRGEIELIAIIMHSKDVNTRFDDARILLDYGFERVTKIHEIDKDRIERKVFVRDGIQATVEVGPEDDLIFPLLDNEDERNLTVTYDLPKIVNAGIKAGDVIGQAVLRYDGKPVASVPFVARENVKQGFSISSTLVGWTEPLISVAQDFFTVLLA